MVKGIICRNDPGKVRKADHLDKAYQEIQLHAEETIPEAKMTDNAVTFLKAEKDGSLKLQKMERVNGIYVVVNDA